MCSWPQVIGAARIGAGHGEAAVGRTAPSVPTMYLMVRTEQAPFVPVIVGGDVGAYSVARAFHQEYGVRSHVISQHATWVVRYSRILHHVAAPDPTDHENLLAVLRSDRFASLATADRPVLLLGSSDSAVQAIIRLGDRRPDHMIAPYVDQERFDRATLKQNFSRLCAELEVNHPATRILDLATAPAGSGEVPFGFPAIVKPADVTAWHHVTFEGKKKVHRVERQGELDALVRAVHASGYHEKLILQEFVPGDDQSMRILTCYCDRNSEIRLASWGETILEEHTPGALGNPAAILTGEHPEIVEQAQTLVRALNWVGYANFDLKVDPRDGSVKFFELNPRLGRSNFYLTGAGHNPVTFYVDEYVRDGLPERFELVQRQDETVFTIVPRRLVLRYVTDPDRRRRVRAVFRRNGARNPLWYAADRDPRRLALIAVAQLNYVKKFLTHYRTVQDTPHDTGQGAA